MWLAKLLYNSVPSERLYVRIWSTRRIDFLSRWWILKSSNQNFLKLQDELASTENTIQTARVRFNESVELYNNHILKFPNNLFLGKYKEKPYFDAEPGSEKAPEVKF